MKKYKFMGNIGLKIIAFFFAVFLWLIVVNIDDPVGTATYSEVPVAVKNEQVVSGEGKTYQILDGTESVSVKVTAKRSILEKISKDSIVAEADMREMEIESLIPITVTVEGYEDKCEAEATPHNLVVRIDDVKKKTFPVTVSASGTPQDGCIVGSMTPNPEKITFSGSEVLIDSIDKVVVRVDVTGLSEDKTLTGDLILYDGQENVIAQNKLKNNLSENGVQVNVQVLYTKEVPVNFSVSGSPADGYIYTGLSSEPQDIQICGTQEDLAEVKEIDVPASEIDISGTSEKQEMTIDILPYLPEGIQLVDATANNIVVTVTIEQEGARTIEFPMESIRVNNLSDKFDLSFDSAMDVELKFTGVQEKLDALDITNAVSIDLKNCTEAKTYEVPLNVEVPSGIHLVKQPSIKVVLTAKTDGTEKGVDELPNNSGNNSNSTEEK